MTVVVFVFFAIAVTIAVTITIPVTTGVEGYAVEYYGHVAELLFLIDGFEFGKLTSVEFAGTDYEYGEVGHAVDNRRVSHYAHRH